ncbi:unnamed protein product, partial [Meganyctiphanes norvegica]
MSMATIPEPLSFVAVCPFQSQVNFEAHSHKLQELKVYHVNLSDIINCIEPVENIDVLQLFLESLITLLSIAANTLTIVVIWEVSLTHPAQAIRVAMSVFDLLQGLFGCGMAVFNHSYYLWCASKTERCEYTVNIILWRGNLYILHHKVYLMLSLIFWASFNSNYFILVIATFERYLSICYPLLYHFNKSISITRLAIIITWMTFFVYWFLLLLFREYDLVWTSAYCPLTKTMIPILIKESLIVVHFITSTILAMIVMICMIALVVLLLYQLNKASTRSKSLTEGMDESTLSTEAIDFNKTLVISMMVEVLALLVPQMVFESLVFTTNNKTSGKLGTGKEFSLYIYFTQWFVLSSTFFNFLLYILRIPAFRSKSLNIIKNGIKSCSKMFTS